MRVPSKTLLLFLCAMFAPVILRSETTPAITISPGLTVVAVNASLKYTAAVSGLSNTAVKWEVNDVVGGNSTVGTISTAGVYKAPAKLPGGSDDVTVTALGSDGKTKGSVAVKVAPVGPPITSITPKPIAPGKYSITIHGSGFKSGAMVRNGTAGLTVHFVSSTELTAVGYQATMQSGVFQVSNPGTAWGTSLAVSFKANGTAPKISPSTIYVHLGNSQQFTPTGDVTYWSASEGTVSQTGYFVAPAKMPASASVTVTAAGPGGLAVAKVTLAEGAEPTISPKTASVEIGQKQQFTSAGATTWSAKYGTINATGLYTAPLVWPQSGSDTISLNGVHGSASEAITITPPVPVITAAGSGGQIPLAMFQVTVQGKNFSPSSTVALCGSNQPATYSSGALIVKGFCGQPGPTTLTVRNGNLTSQPFPVQIGVVNPKASPATARRFLEQAAFGPAPSDAEYVQSIGIPAWLSGQFKMAQVSNYKKVSAAGYDGMPEQFLTNAVEMPDQLRQRVAWALSQIFVTSLIELGPNQNMITYQDMLLADAFTNYRQIMSDVTLSSAMGQYLNMADNAKAKSTAGSLANENFAREMMQLFTIGTSMLNSDGSVQVDSNGIPIPTYSQFTVTEFARVYTGWTYAPKPGTPVEWEQYNTGGYGPMVPYTAEHDFGSKQLLNGYVSPANVSPQVDLNNALDNIFNHPNVGPFVCTQLIQHLVKSNPSSAYVSRVVAAFNNNGSGVRGDMKAVITAILTDSEARANDEGGDDQPTDGRLQEPALFVAAMVRAFAGQMTVQNYYSWQLGELGQGIFSAPSVFNYYAPNYNVPGTSLMGGEFQIHSPNNAILRANLVTGLFGAWSDPIASSGPGTNVDLTSLIPLGTNPAKLVDALDLCLTHGVMPTTMKDTIVTAVTGETGGNLRRLQRGIYLILSSSYYNVWH
jgi:uncharacterized protein (DUF1800 family)